MTIQPEGEDLRKATRWISEKRTTESKTNLSTLIEQACVKFDLGPKDAEFLMRFFTTKQKH